MDIPVVITARLMDIESELESHRHRITALETERDSLRLAVDVLTKTPQEWKYIEGGAQIVVDRLIQPAVVVPPQTAENTSLPKPYPIKKGGSFSVIERKIVSTLHHLGPVNRHLLADAVGMKPDALSIRLTKMKARHLVAHDANKGIWSAA